jgi:hypothetical protein
VNTRNVLVAVVNSVLTINCITIKLFGPSIIHINKSLKTFKNFRFLIWCRNVSYNRSEMSDIIKINGNWGILYAFYSWVLLFIWTYALLIVRSALLIIICPLRSETDHIVFLNNNSCKRTNNSMRNVSTSLFRTHYQQWFVSEWFSAIRSFRNLRNEYKQLWTFDL